MIIPTLLMLAHVCVGVPTNAYSTPCEEETSSFEGVSITQECEVATITETETSTVFKTLSAHYTTSYLTTIFDTLPASTNTIISTVYDTSTVYTTVPSTVYTTVPSTVYETVTESCTSIAPFPTFTESGNITTPSYSY